MLVVVVTYLLASNRQDRRQYEEAVDRAEKRADAAEERTRAAREVAEEARRARYVAEEAVAALKAELAARQRDGRP